jgi:hypothetical protein
MRPCRSSSGGMWLSVPTVLVVLCVACCRSTRLMPRSASFATTPPGASSHELTSTLRALTACGHVLWGGGCARGVRQRLQPHPPLGAPAHAQRQRRTHPAASPSPCTTFLLCSATSPRAASCSSTSSCSSWRSSQGSLTAVAAYAVSVPWSQYSASAVACGGVCCVDMLGVSRRACPCARARACSVAGSSQTERAACHAARRAA